MPTKNSVSSINIFFIVHIVQNKAFIYSTGNKIDLAVENYQRALEIDKKNELKYLNKIIWRKITDKKYRDAECFVNEYDSIAHVRYAGDSIQLNKEQRKTQYFRDLLKNEHFFMDD